MLSSATLQSAIYYRLKQGRNILQNVFVCRYKPSPEEVTAACDVTFAMLADPECAVSMLYFNYLLSISYWEANSGLFADGGCMWKAWSCKWYGSRKRVFSPCSFSS